MSGDTNAKKAVSGEPGGEAAMLTVGSRSIGGNSPVYMIAEMSANHAGSLARAKEIIHAARESGADCIKIQT